KVRAHPTRQYWADQMPDDPIRSVIWTKCQVCHDLQRTVAFARPKDQWQHVVEGMVARGAPLTPDEIPKEVDYVATHFGMDSPTNMSPAGRIEVGIKPCKQSEWPKGCADFRKKWTSPYNIWASGQQGGNIYIIDPIRKDVVSVVTCISAPDRVEFSRDGNTA